nr:hypothetical protein B0A51_07948 [Rachicladosporium sp. CCFEE 5018]
MASPSRKRPRRKSPADASFRPNPALSPMRAAYPDDEYDEGAIDRSPRHVSWTSRLEQDATKPDRARASMSPARSSMKQALPAEDEDEDEYEYEDRMSVDGPTAEEEKLLFSPISGLKGKPKRAYRLGELFGGTPLWQIKGDAAKDETLCAAMHDLRDMTVTFSKYFCRPDPKLTKDAVKEICKDEENVTLVRYIGCLAMGGPDGLADWRVLFQDGLQLEALAMGVVSRALKEHVFSALWFAADEKLEKKLDLLDMKHVEKDGFYRTEQRAKKCRELSQGDLQFKRNVAKVSAQMASHLRFLYDLNVHVAKDPKKTYYWEDLERELYDIVTFAAKLSQEMRCVDDVVYYWSPTFKDEEFEPARMECYNLADMITKSPYRKKKVDGRDTAVLHEPDKGHEAIVRIVLSLGLIAYRKGGGDLAEILLKNERTQADGEAKRLPPDVRHARSLSRDSPHKLTGEEGFRTRLICKSAVQLQWGQQRLLTRQAGTSTHIGAVRKNDMSKYVNDRAGFVELFDVFLKEHPTYRVPVPKEPEVEAVSGRGK